MPSQDLNTLLPSSVARPINLIVLHCSATPSGKPILGPWGVATVIDEWHRQRGFARTEAIAKSFNPTLKSIGYHFVIDLDGTVSTGRHLEEVGAHVSGFNRASVGICLVGGTEPQARYTEAQWAVLAALVRRLAALLRVPVLDHLVGGKGVCGHRELFPDLNSNGVIERNEWLKTCPGFDVGGWISRGFNPLPDNQVKSGASQ